MTHSHRTTTTWLAVLLLMTAVGAPLHGQSIAWRSDYNTARKEAAEQGRPLLLVFGTDSCLWCKKLEALTLHDPSVANVVAKQFIALKVNAEREPLLTQLLRITQFPTMVLGAPDGKIIGILEGFQDAATLAEQLAKVAMEYGTPDWMLRDFQEAAKAINGSDYARAVALLKSITDDGKHRSVQVKARQVLSDLEQQAAGRLVRAKQLHDRGLGGEAAETLTELLRRYAGTQAAAEGSLLLTTVARKPELRGQVRRQRAAELLALARDDFQTRQFMGCLEHCDLLTSVYADLPESEEAKHLADSVKGNPERLAKACGDLTERMGVMYLTLAESWLKKGNAHEAQLCLEKVVQAAPGTRPAEQARLQLAKLQKGGDALQAEFKGP